MPSGDEFVEIELADASDTAAAWSSRDFVRHYYNGRGRGVTVRETGHLSRIVAQYMSEVSERLKGEIARAARRHPNGTFSNDFVNTYNMTGIVFSIGDTTIGGSFSGSATERNGVIFFLGQLEFCLKDEFADPLDIGVEAIDPGETIFENLLRPLDDHGRARLGLPPSGPQRLGIHTGEPYLITDLWAGEFSGQVYADLARSNF